MGGLRGNLCATNFYYSFSLHTYVDENQESKGRVRLSPIDAKRKKTRSKPHKRASETTP